MNTPIEDPPAVTEITPAPIATLTPTESPRQTGMEPSSTIPHFDESAPTNSVDIKSKAFLGNSPVANQTEIEPPAAASPKTPPAKPLVGQHDLVLDVPLKIIGHDGVVVDLPVHLTFPGILSPAFASMAFNQFETVLDQLLVMPAKVALNAYLEAVITARKADVTPVKKRSSSAENNEDCMLPEEVLNTIGKTKAVMS